MSRGLSRTNKSREVFHQFADIVDFMSSNGLAREETSTINLRPVPSSHALLEPKMGAEATFCKGGGVSDEKKGAAAGAAAFLSCSHSPFASFRLLPICFFSSVTPP